MHFWLLRSPAIRLASRQTLPETPSFPQPNSNSNSPCGIVFAKVAPAVRPPPPVGHQGLQQLHLVLRRAGLHGAERYCRRPPLLLMGGMGWDGILLELLVVLAEVGPERRYVCIPQKY